MEDKSNKVETSSSTIFVIQINLSTFASQVSDSGCGSHICTNLHGHKRSRELTKGEIDLGFGSEANVVVLAIKTYVLILPSGLIIQLENCYYVHVISSYIIFIFCLNKFGFSFIINNSCCSI